MDAKKYSFWATYESRDDLQRFGNCALLLFTLQLKFDIEDITLVSTNSLTEGSGDKKADLVYIDSEAGHAVIAQTYVAESLTSKDGKPKTEAPANKASDLNTAVTWLLRVPISDLPEGLKSHAEELRQKISEGAIQNIYIWYVHNLPESKNVSEELKTVEHTTDSVIKSCFPQCTNISIQALEVGVATLDEWYKAILTPILISDEFDIPIPGGFEIAEADWKAYVTAIPATWLYQLFRTYKTDIFSANVREYLGSRKADENINNGIKQTAQSDPGHFWVYNNGITVLVNKFQEFKEAETTELRIGGFAIVNGSQTTGAIGNLDKPPEGNTMVPVRFIKCNNKDTLRSIVRYNNSQNKITAPDFRSNDSIQRRLSDEFKAVSDLEYLPRRGGSVDVIKRRANALYSVTAGQALAAFHSDPDIAYHEKTHMWEDDKLYSKYFGRQTTARHIVFAYSLLEAVENRKIELWNKSKENTLLGIEEKQFNFFRKRGSTFLLVSAIAECLEIVLQKQIPNPFNLTFKDNPRIEEATGRWTEIVNAASAFVDYLIPGLSDGFKTRKTVEQAIGSFQSLLASTQQANAKIYGSFAAKVA